MHISNQHTIHAESDIVMAFLSICP